LISGCVVIAALIAPITVPSFGATLAMWFVATSEPAPGMFCTTICGLPGICRRM
jgi:hypothetical protein